MHMRLQVAVRGLMRAMEVRGSTPNVFASAPAACVQLRADHGALRALGHPRHRAGVLPV